MVESLATAKSFMKSIFLGPTSQSGFVGCVSEPRSLVQTVTLQHEARLALEHYEISMRNQQTETSREKSRKKHHKVRP